MVTEAAAKAAFLREGWVAARLRSPWLGTAIQLPAGRQSCLYLVLPFIPGETLEQRLSRDPRLSLEDGRVVALRLCQAVAWAVSNKVTFTRLVEMGVEPFLVASAVRAFLAQRLVRSLCPQCKEVANYSKEKLSACGFGEGVGKTVYGASPAGCAACRNTGYYGRLAIYEIVMVTPGMQDLISAKSNANVLLRQARKDGHISLREYGWRKVLEGVTTVEEVMRVTSEDFLE